MYSIHTRLVRPRTVVALLVLLLLAAISYGFAAANTVPDSGAGDGTGQVSGYEAQNIDYILDTTDPSLISEVHFTLIDDAATAGAAPRPRDVKIALLDSVNSPINNGAGQSYTTCAVAAAGAFTVTCTGVDTSVLPVLGLRIIAVD